MVWRLVPGLPRRVEIICAASFVELCDGDVTNPHRAPHARDAILRRVGCRLNASCLTNVPAGLRVDCNDCGVVGHSVAPLLCSVAHDQGILNLTRRRKEKTTSTQTFLQRPVFVAFFGGVTAVSGGNSGETLFNRARMRDPGS